MALTDFQKAFALARKQKGDEGEFDFGGKEYNTKLAPDPIDAGLAKQRVMQSHNIAPRSQAKKEIIDNRLTFAADPEAVGEVVEEDDKKEDDNREMASAIGDLFAGQKKQASQAKMQAINPQTKDMMQARRQALMNLVKGQ